MTNPEKKEETIQEIHLENPSLKQEKCPEENANFLSRITYWWINTVFWAGYKRPLEKADLWLLSSRFHSKTLTDSFDECWKQEISDFASRKAQKEASGKASLKETEEKPSVYRALKSMIFWELAPVGFIKVVCDISTVSSPLLLKAIIDYVAKSSIDPQPLWLGTLLLNLYFAKTTTIGMSLRTALSTALYRKSLKLSAAARQDYNAGKVMNIVSTDCQRIESFIMFCHVLWTAPLQILMITGMLVWQLGLPALAGIGLLVVLSPVQGVLYKKLAAIRKTVAPIADKRVKSTQELLQGIRLIKFFAWEDAFLGKIEDLRGQEIKQVFKKSILNAFVMAIVFGIPVISSSIAFVIYGVTNETLEPSRIFSALTWFGELRFPLMFLPSVIVGLADFKVAIKRIGDMLLAPEVDKQPEINPKSEYGVQVIDGEFLWDSLEDPENPEKKKEASHLTNINLSIRKGSLVAVVGAVGSGKSSLLNALVGEMKRVKGQVIHSGSVGYASQQAWIQNATLQNNITFGLEMNQDRYLKAIRDCALERDIEVFPDGDQTEIGERGINCSGGQKQRINLARCVYFDSDIVLLDDPLSAVDAHVGKYLFDNCIMGALKEKTRILVTHQLHFLPRVDYVVCMNNGKIVEQGTYKKLMESKGEMCRLMMNFGGGEEDKDGAGKPVADELTSLKDLEAQKLKKQGKSARELMISEERTVGAVQGQIWWKYMKAAGGYHFVSFLVLFLVLTQLTRLATDVWLVQWTSNRIPWLDTNAYVGIFLTLGVSQAVSSYFMGLFFAFKGTRAAKTLHQAAARRLIRAPVTFFDRTPLGRIINRFSKDQDGIDNTLADSFRMFVSTLAITISTFALIISATPWFAAPLVPLMLVYYVLQKVYRATSRELKRLDSISRSPLYAHFGETLNGLPTIRAYREEGRFNRLVQKLFDETNSPYFLVLMAQRWLSVRLEIIGALLTFFAASFGVLARDSISPALLGLSLSYALQVTGTLNWCIRQFTETEVAMNAVERVSYYGYEIENEPDAVIPSNRPAEQWPDKGLITVKDLQMRYSPELPLILKNLSFQVNSQEKIGVVGRTGSGKSSLMNALFRMVEFGGLIEIDYVNIQQIGLTDLRSRLAIIPQDPVLFSATVRFNLDPFNEYSDSDMWSCLEKANLKAKISQMEGGLEAMIAEGGENLSVGQRQLLCLARALLRKPRVLIMDEATANVDYETDTIIQKCLRVEFKDATILTIAHRLNTIVDYDRVIVLKDGEIVEFDAPKRLLDTDGVFKSMVDETGPSNAAMLYELASKAQNTVSKQ